MPILLKNLNPEVKGGVLLFDCPCGQHRMRIPIIAEKKFANGAWWAMTGELPNVTLRNPHGAGPHSVDASPCFHVTFTDGVGV